ncbi:hypothetical protein [Amantichitinum ursilacus]|uniref:Uncharacterized protein n=1 Tax=Amantichitinum ursilacus TaxID=857265 RepID=A0A0N0XJS4_9NEIS|nr:hypothetical protein [Amantichitinum ursilacus]KPC52576.1 hypothetical protein WG78_12050 [Amantichitinum ursilacus]
MLFSAIANAQAQRVAASRRPLPQQVELECEAMVRYLLQHGMPVAPEGVARLVALTTDQPVLTAQQNAELVHLHQKLARAVAPATPQGITVLDQEKLRASPWSWLGPVPLIRRLTLNALAFLLGVVLIGLFPQVTEANMDAGLLGSSGWVLFVNMAYLLSCAGLGAAFATLFQAHRYIADCSYDPKYDASYGARLILGVIAGLIIVEMLPAGLFESGSMANFGKPALAMLGGFSATAVERLLQRLVDTLETLVRGDGAAQLQAGLRTQRAQGAAERVQTQADLAARMLALQTLLDAGTPPALIREQMTALIQSLLSTPDAAASDATASTEQ